MTNKADAEILSDAPEGATYIDNENDYCKIEGEFYSYYETENDEWVIFDGAIGLRSLADIKALVEKDKRIAELSKRRDLQKKDFDERIAEREKEIFVQQKQIAKLVIMCGQHSVKIAELEKENERLTRRINDTFEYCEAVKKSLPKRDLEQRLEELKSLQECADEYCEEFSDFPELIDSHVALIERQLREQAKGGDL